MTNFIVGNKVTINSKHRREHGMEGTIVSQGYNDFFSVVILSSGIFCGNTITIRASELIKKGDRNDKEIIL